MLLKATCECGYGLSAQRRDALDIALKEHQEASEEPEKHRPAAAKRL